MTLEENYKVCRKILKNFIKKGYWESFSSADLFYLIEGKTRSIFTFVEQFFNDCFGAQLFFNRNGLNYVHDILTTNGETSVTIHDCDSICAVFVPKSELKDDEIEFLKNCHVRINESSNLIFHRFAAGFGPRVANNKEISIFLNNITYLASIIRNEFDDICDAFKNNKTVVALMDNIKLQYSVVYRSLPYLEELPRRKKINESFVEEFKNSTYVNDECFIFTAYLPAVIKDTNIRPLALYFYFPKLNKHIFKYINDTPKEYESLLYSHLYDVFTTIGIPYKINFNNRLFYAYLEKTLDAMNIEHEFIREDFSVDSNVNEILSKVYESTRDSFIENDELITTVMNSISSVISELQDNDDIEMPDNDELIS